MALSRDIPLPRPALPLLLQCAAFLWVGCLVAGQVCNALPIAGVLAVSCLFAALCVLAFFLLKQNDALRVVLVRVLFCFIGAVLVAASFQVAHSKRDALLEQGAETCTMRILEDPTESSFGYKATVLSWRTDASLFERLLGSWKATVQLDDDSLKFGDEFQATATFLSIDDSSIAYFDTHGLAVRCKVSSIEQIEPSNLGLLSEVRASFARSVDERLSVLNGNGDAIAIVKALVVGDRQDLFASSFYDDVKVAGLAHMVAVSGAHLVIVMGLVGGFVKATRVPKRPAIFLQLGLLFLYLVMVGFPVSCIRAAFMAGVGILSFSSARRSYALSSLGVTVIAMIALDSSAAFSISFGLSALSTLGIVLFTPLFCSWLPSLGKRFDSLIFEPFAMTCAALLLTFPLSIASFSQFSVVSPVSNIVAVPLITISCMLGVLSFVFMPVTFVSGFLLEGSYFVARAFVGAVGLLASFPNAAIPVDIPIGLMVCFSVALCILLWVAWPKSISRKAASTVLAAFLILTLVPGLVPNRKTTITMLDVGQGDAFLIKSEGVTLLIDTGNNQKKLYAGLARQGITHLDGVLLSHADDDHCGCLSDLRGTVSVDSVYLAKGIKGLDTSKAQNLVDDAEEVAGKDNVHELTAGDSLVVGAMDFKVISPAGLTDEGENDDSLCLLGSSDLNEDGTAEWRMLFAGDAESDVLDELASKGELEDIDILKVSHHGAKSALDEKLLEVLKPEIALVSVGERNRYGHPAPNTLSLLEAQNAQVFRTDKQGDVVCSLTMDAIQVSTMK